ncbi:saccharopine dehydrogenase NADP-binding domain-containing protein [Jatrophihabitans telluris]|uniref:Saccharopine dehydrogenase NADP-binding domain-containing protein n=1 Tax=Jatrophihabitans telluris TaxID=2038343 RepID=A0ABY4R1E4_9ACTN|nr:saccharopine dehydrogenase NADP-binding domain-containing protein [Jatrophihabitans telluris]UQX89327.1 saccharopine dehydrogenase NADP-binding domain-containing protein [Jatrophihabitans telluris]
MVDRADRPFDLVLFGASGFTGGLTAAYLAGQAPVGLRWALAGRNLDKLAHVRDRLARSGDGGPELPLVYADSSDPESLAELAACTRVLASTVGPYLRHGEGLVGACARQGTDYLDLTGEAEFVDRMYNLYHRQAQRSGARLVHCCGFDSIPHDLGVLFTVLQLPSDVPIAVEGVVRAGGRISAGTIHSAVTAMSRLRAAAREHRTRAEGDPGPAGRSVHARAGRIRRVDGRWLVPLPTIDPQVVTRSAQALTEYGPDFSYGHYAGVDHLATIVAGGLTIGGVMAIAQIPPARSLLLRRVTSGVGPSEQQREAGWFTVRFTARTPEVELVTEVSGGDPGYGETARMLGESALCLALDDLPQRSGQLTPAVAMGSALIDRLVAAGLRFDVVGRVRRTGLGPAQ